MRLAVLLIALVTAITLLGKWTEERRREEFIRNSYKRTYDPSVDLGVEPPPEHPRRLNVVYQPSKCLSSEELQENIEDLEMKGLIDDEGELEQLRYELK